MRKINKQLIFKITSGVVSSAMLVLSCIYLRGLPKFILLGAIIAFASLGVLITNTDSSKHEAFFKILIVSLAVCSVVLICYVVLDKAGILDKIQDTETLLQIIRDTKHWGVIVFILFIILEIICLPIPGAVSAFIGAALYGPFLGFLFITIGTFIGSIICFALGKVFGKRLVEWMVGPQKTKEYADMLNEKGKFLFIVMMIFPFFPDDILCLVAGITSMTYKYFIITISITRPIMIAFMCYFVEGSIIPFTGWGVPVWIAIFAISLVLFMILGKIKDKIMNKKTEESIKPLKK